MNVVTECEEIEVRNCMQLKGGLFPLTTLQILHHDIQAIEEQLATKIEQAPNFFDNAPIVIDLHHLSKNNSDNNPEEKTDIKVDFFALRHILINKNLIPVGVKNASQQQQQAAIDANLAILRSHHGFENHSQKLKANTAAEPKNTPEVAPPSSITVAPESSANSTNNTRKNKLIAQPVRSGQQIYAPDGDITIIGSVSNGAELLADGSVHVYGALRGRVLAGINNNEQARIFCNSLEADLISIAGQFKISENIDPKFWKKQVQIYLTNGKLEITEFV
jgi:septum site-determining protein MinC